MRTALCLWDPTGSFDGVLDRSTIDAALQFTTSSDASNAMFRPFILSTISRAAEFLYCNTANGNALFTVPARDNRTFALVKKSMSATELGQLSIDAAFDDMPRLKAWIETEFGSLAQAGWAKRLNNASSAMVADLFFQATSPLLAGIGRPSSQKLGQKLGTTKDDDNKKRAREISVSDPNSDPNSPASSLPPMSISPVSLVPRLNRPEGHAVPEKVAKQKKQTTRRQTKKSKTDHHQSRQMVVEHRRKWVESAYDFLDRTKLYIAALENPRIQAVQKFCQAMTVQDYDADNWEARETAALALSGLSGSSELAEYQVPVSDLRARRAFFELPVSSQYDQVMHELQSLPDAHRPHWLTLEKV